MEDIESRVETIFREIGLKKTVKGYILWKRAISEIYNNIITGNELDYFKMENAYSLIAEKENVTKDNSERSLRNLIRNSEQKIQKYFNYKLHITNKTFLMLVIDKLKMEEYANAKRYKKEYGKRIKTVLQ